MKFIKEHALSIIVVLLAGAGCMLIYTHHVHQINTEITAMSAKHAALMDAADKHIALMKLQDAKLAAEAAKSATTAPTSIQASKRCNDSDAHNDPTSIDVIVNKKHCMQPLDYAPPLATAYGASLQPIAIHDFTAMYQAAQAAGVPFIVTSSYRSYSDQIGTYDDWMASGGAKEADAFAARPGYSEHQTGLAFDVMIPGCALHCFGTTSQYKWLQQHAAEYGFIQRYRKGFEAITGYGAEEWHYRYVGKQVAQDMQNKGIKTLEQYWDISGGDYY